MRTTWKPPGNKTKLTFLIVLTFLFFISGSVYGQEEVKKEYWGNGKLKSKTRHNGLGSVWYESGKKKIERLYKNGEKDGLETHWYESGEKEIEVHFKNGKLEGLGTLWHKTGEKQAEAHFKKGELEGL